MQLGALTMMVSSSIFCLQKDSYSLYHIIIYAHVFKYTFYYILHTPMLATRDFYRILTLQYWAFHFNYIFRQYTIKE